MTSKASAQTTQKKIIRKGANGVLLKNFENVLHDVFSSSSSSTEICQQALDILSPRYSKLPPFLKEVEQMELVKVARASWDTESTQQQLDDYDTSPPTPLSPPWPFDKRTNLPSCGCVRGGEDATHKPKKTKTGKDKGGVGHLYNQQRAWRKEMQLANMIQCVMALLPDHVRNHSVSNSSGGDCSGLNSKRKYRIVDFAGGTGHLAVPLALLLPQCEVVCVDLKKWSLDLLHRRVDGVAVEGEEDEKDTKGDEYTQNGQHKQPQQSNSVQVSQKIPNLSSYLGSIQSYNEDFDIGISLHACGEASDCVLRKCLEKKPVGLFVAAAVSTGDNEKEISYPQSKALASFMDSTVDNDDDGDENKRCELPAERFDEIARAADYSELGDVRKPRNACRRAAKSLVEWDRLLFCKECNDSNDVHVVLTRMVPWEASTKNDILIGWYNQSCNPYRRRKDTSDNNNLVTDSSAIGTPPDDPSSQVDFQIALQHLFGGLTAHEKGNNSAPTTICDQNDWSPEEVAEIQSQLDTFVNNGATDVHRFSRGMGSRKRKLIHFVAEKMGLRHWGEGKKDGEKIVVVARRKTENAV